MIPKKIHYCWFGGNEINDLARKCIESWKKYCPEYEIIRWDEKNYDIHRCPYVEEAYYSKKWAFVSDYARLDIIYHNGGIYLDTDVELVNGLDELLSASCFLGMETPGVIATGLGFGAEKGNKNIALMLNEYKTLHFKIKNKEYDTIPCPIRNTRPFKTLGLTNKNMIQYINDAKIYPPEYFCPLNYQTKELTLTPNTIAIHYFNASWISDEEKEMKVNITEYRKTHNAIFSFLYKLRYSYKIKYDTFKWSYVIEFISSKIKYKIRMKLNSK